MSVLKNTGIDDLNNHQEYCKTGMLAQTTKYANGHTECK